MLFGPSCAFFFLFFSNKPVRDKIGHKDLSFHLFLTYLSLFPLTPKKQNFHQRFFISSFCCVMSIIMKSFRFDKTFSFLALQVWVTMFQLMIPLESDSYDLFFYSSTTQNWSFFYKNLLPLYLPFLLFFCSTICGPS